MTYFGVMPFQISPIDSDSTLAHIKIFSGVGRFIRIPISCYGEKRIEKIPFGEINVSYDKKFKNFPMRIGINGSIISIGEDEGKLKDYTFMPYINPFVNFEWRYFAFGFGAGIIPNTQPGLGSLYLRLGNYDKLYLDASVLHTPPIITGGCMRAGLGVRVNTLNKLWVGTGFVPYEYLGIIGQLEHRIKPDLYVNTLIFYGHNEGEIEGAISLGLTYGLNKKNKR